MLKACEGNLNISRIQNTSISQQIPTIIPKSMSVSQISQMLGRMILFCLEAKDRIFQCGLFKLLLTWNVP